MGDAYKSGSAGTRNILVNHTNKMQIQRPETHVFENNKRAIHHDGGVGPKVVLLNKRWARHTAFRFALANFSVAAQACWTLSSSVWQQLITTFSRLQQAVLCLSSYMPSEPVALKHHFATQTSETNTSPYLPYGWPEPQHPSCNGKLHGH